MFDYILLIVCFGLLAIVGWSLKKLEETRVLKDKIIEEDKIRRAWDKQFGLHDVLSPERMSFEDFRRCLEQRDKEKFDQMSEVEQLISELNTLNEFGLLPDKRTPGDVIDKLSTISDTRAIEALIQVAENPINSSCSKGSAKPHYLQSLQRRMRVGAIYALGKSDDKRATDSLVKMLSDKDKDIRTCTVEALEKLGWDSDSA